MAATHERRVFILSLRGGAARRHSVAVLLELGNYSTKVTWTLGTFVVGCWLIVALVVRERVVRPLQTLSNMLAALREGDFSLRARSSASDDALALALLEVNTLGNTLQAQRLGAMEATALLRTVMAEIDAAIFAFDAGNQLRLANRAGERLLGDAGRAPARAHGGRVRPRRVPHAATRRACTISSSRAERPVGGPPHDVPAGRPPAHARRDVGPEQDPARGGAARVAAARARAQSRDQQLADADQVDRGEPAESPRPLAAPA